jgi:hypothetical protein
MNKVELAGEIYGDLKRGTSKTGAPWSAFKLKVMNGKYYSLIPVYCPGKSLTFSKGEIVSIYGKLVEQYRANKADPVQFQVEAIDVAAEGDLRGSNPEIDDIDLAF